MNLLKRVGRVWVLLAFILRWEEFCFCLMWNLWMSEFLGFGFSLLLLLLTSKKFSFTHKKKSPVSPEWDLAPSDLNKIVTTFRLHPNGKKLLFYWEVDVVIFKVVLNYWDLKKTLYVFVFGTRGSFTSVSHLRWRIWVSSLQRCTVYVFLFLVARARPASWAWVWLEKTLTSFTQQLFIGLQK